MPFAFTQTNLTVPVGHRQFTIDGIPPNSIGFEILLSRDAATMSGTGTIFTAQLEISPDNGVTFTPWHTFSLDASDDPRKKDGTPLAVYRWAFTWPGEYLGGTRQELKQTDVRISIDVLRAFFTPSLTVQRITAV